MYRPHENKAAVAAFESSDSVAALVRMAVEDAGKLDREIYLPSGGDWHKPGCSSCLVCDAGAVIAARYGLARRESVWDPSAFGSPADVRLLAIDAVRVGNYTDAYDFMDQPERAGRVYGWMVEHGHRPPAQTDFVGWEPFEQHLRSLSRVADALDQFESEVSLH